MNITLQQSKTILSQGNGLLRLTPCWVPRAVYLPGGRLKLHPVDLYAFGAHRGAINTRWLSSTITADNGPYAGQHEGMSEVVFELNGKTQTALLADFVQTLGSELIGERLWQKYRRWPILSKLFDFCGSLPHHLHLTAQHAALVGRETKPEGYYFPYQFNSYRGDFPYTYFGLEPGTTPDQVRRCLEIWDQGDNQITNLSKAYRLEPGSGWVLPAGTLHSPGSLVTYEPQWGSDVGAVFQSVVNQKPVSWTALVKDVPSEKHSDLDFLVSLIDWEVNTCSNFRERYFRKPQPVRALAEMEEAGYQEHWISFGSPYFAAKELVVLPGREVVIKDLAAYGMILVQGYGEMNGWDIETPTMIRFGQHTSDEFFVSEQAAHQGIRIKNRSACEPLVMFKHFAPGSGAPE